MSPATDHRDEHCQWLPTFPVTRQTAQSRSRFLKGWYNICQNHCGHSWTRPLHLTTISRLNVPRAWPCHDWWPCCVNGHSTMMSLIQKQRNSLTPIYNKPWNIEVCCCCNICQYYLTAVYCIIIWFDQSMALNWIYDKIIYGYLRLWFSVEALTSYFNLHLWIKANLFRSVT